MRLPRLSRSALFIALVLALGLSGCNRPAERVVTPGKNSTEASRSVNVTAAAEASGTTQSPGAGDPAERSGPIGASEAEKLESELEAIERELDTLDMPSDSDFEDIEGSLD